MGVLRLKRRFGDHCDTIFRAEEGMAKKKKVEFSVTKAVKRNAREHVGQPKPQKVILPEPQQTRRERRHKETLVDLLKQEE